MISGGALPFVYYRKVQAFVSETADTKAIYNEISTGKIWSYNGSEWVSVQDEIKNEIIKLNSRLGLLYSRIYGGKSNYSAGNEIAISSPQLLTKGVYDVIYSEHPVYNCNILSTDNERRVSARSTLTSDTKKRKAGDILSVYIRHNDDKPLLCYGTTCYVALINTVSGEISRKYITVSGATFTFEIKEDGDYYILAYNHSLDHSMWFTTTYAEKTTQSTPSNNYHETLATAVLVTGPYKLCTAL